MSNIQLLDVVVGSNTKCTNPWVELNLKNQFARRDCTRAYTHMVKLTLDLCETLGSEHAFSIYHKYFQKYLYHIIYFTLHCSKNITIFINLLLFSQIIHILVYKSEEGIKNKFICEQ